MHSSKSRVAHLRQRRLGFIGVALFALLLLGGLSLLPTIPGLQAQEFDESAETAPLLVDGRSLIEQYRTLRDEPALVINQADPKPEVDLVEQPTLSDREASPSLSSSDIAKPSPIVVETSPELLLPAPTLGNKRDPTTPLDGNDLQTLKINMLESSDRISQTEASRERFIVALDEYVAGICMPKLHHELAYDPTKARSVECEAALEKLRYFDPTSPTVTCVENGMDTRECVAAFLTQKVETYSPEDSTELEQLGLTTDERLNANASAVSGNQTLARADAEFRQLRPKMNRDGPISDATRKRLEEVLIPLIRGTCSASMMRLKPEGTESLLRKIPQNVADAINQILPAPSASPTALPQPARESELAALAARLDAHSRPAEPAVNSAPKFQRIRYIPRKCKEYLDAFLKTSPDNPLAICSRDGAYTPSCLGSLRLAAARKRAQAIGTPGSRASYVESPGISSF